MPPPEKLIGRCTKGMFNVCTFRARFHLFLANMGKTNVTTDPLERQWFGKKQHLLQKAVPTPAPVFLYEVSQLSDPNMERSKRFVQDLQNFLGLQQTLDDSMVWFKPGIKHDNADSLQSVDARKIDICDERYNDLRRTLLNNARNASAWMAQYFVTAPGVTVSSPDYFVQSIMQAWKVDPCIERQRHNATM